jgi:TetR/AcrR family transcriptional regulator, mexJK operon transcriptional repressor
LTATRATTAAPAGRGKGRPSVADSQQIERAIREAAIEALLQHGDAATMHAIARASGLSRKTVYARYPNKEALFLAVLRDLLADAHGVVFDQSGSAADRLHSYIRSALDVIATPAAKAIQRLLVMNPDYVLALDAEMRTATERHFGEPLRKLLREAARAGELGIPDVERTTEAIVTLILSQSHRPPSPDGREHDEAWRDQHARFLTALLCAGLLPRAGDKNGK